MEKFFLWSSILFLAWPLQASDISKRFTPITGFKDERQALVVNDNFNRLTKNMIGDKAFNIPIASLDQSTNIALSQPQADTDYGVFVQASWDAKVKVLQKATTGFLLTFSTPGASGQTLDWILVK